MSIVFYNLKGRSELIDVLPFLLSVTTMQQEEFVEAEYDEEDEDEYFEEEEEDGDIEEGVAGTISVAG